MGLSITFFELPGKSAIFSLTLLLRWFSLRISLLFVDRLKLCMHYLLNLLILMHESAGHLLRDKIRPSAALLLSRLRFNNLLISMHHHDRPALSLVQQQLLHLRSFDLPLSENFSGLLVFLHVLLLEAGVLFGAYFFQVGILLAGLLVEELLLFLDFSLRLRHHFETGEPVGLLRRLFHLLNLNNLLFLFFATAWH